MSSEATHVFMNMYAYMLIPGFAVDKKLCIQYISRGNRGRSCWCKGETEDEVFSRRVLYPPGEIIFELNKILNNLQNYFKNALQVF